VTEVLIVAMLGAGRAEVEEAAGVLQRTGMIDFDKGNITVLDRPAMEARVCECYEVVRKEFRRLLSGTGFTISPAPGRPG
jgi:hypothetical protein